MVERMGRPGRRIRLEMRRRTVPRLKGACAALMIPLVGVAEDAGFEPARA